MNKNFLSLQLSCFPTWIKCHNFFSWLCWCNDKWQKDLDADTWTRKMCYAFDIHNSSPQQTLYHHSWTFLVVKAHQPKLWKALSQVWSFHHYILVGRVRFCSTNLPKFRLMLGFDCPVFYVGVHAHAWHATKTHYFYSWRLEGGSNTQNLAVFGSASRSVTCLAIYFLIRDWFKPSNRFFFQFPYESKLQIVNSSLVTWTFHWQQNSCYTCPFFTVVPSNLTELQMFLRFVSCVCFQEAYSQTRGNTRIESIPSTNRIEPIFNKFSSS